jgi:hypothetical protein
MRRLVVGLGLAIALVVGCAAKTRVASPQLASQRNSLDWTIESEPGSSRTPPGGP